MVTLKDIAFATGLTVDGVSKALRDSPQISQATKERVRKTANDLGYVKNGLAASLASGITKSVAVIINSLFNPYFSIMTHFIISELNKNGYSATIYCEEKHLLENNTAIKQILLNKSCAIISLVQPDNEVIEILKRNNIPMYLVGIKPDDEYINYAISDDFKGGEMVAKYFVKSNFNKAIFISDSVSETSKRREDGFIKFIQQNSKKPAEPLPIDRSTEILIENTIEKIKNESIDFVFCFSDYLGSYLQKQIVINNLDVCLFGYDHISKYIKNGPTLNSVSADNEQIISDIVKHLINNKNEPFKKTYPVTLYINK